MRCSLDSKDAEVILLLYPAQRSEIARIVCRGPLVLFKLAAPLGHVAYSHKIPTQH